MIHSFRHLLHPMVLVLAQLMHRKSAFAGKLRTLTGSRFKGFFQTLLNLPLTLSSKMLTTMPDWAPDPASPTKCPEPMLEAKRDAPT